MSGQDVCLSPGRIWSIFRNQPGGQPTQIVKDPNNPNIVTVYYRTTKREDCTGKLVEGEFKDNFQPKTIYNPDVYSADDIYNYGLEAAKKGFPDGKNGRSYISDYNGVSFQVFLKDGKIDSFHPRVPDIGNLNKTTLSEPESLSAKDLFK